MAEVASQSTILTAESAVRSSAKRSRVLFAADFASPSALTSTSTAFSILPPSKSPEELSEQITLSSRLHTEYDDCRELPAALAAKYASAAASAAARQKKGKGVDADKPSDPKMMKMIDGISAKQEEADNSKASSALILRGNRKTGLPPNANGPTSQRDTPSNSLVRKDAFRPIRPEWHPKWVLHRVISAHLGWVRSLAVEPGNEWFASGAGDRTIKIFNLASGVLRLTLTGHISAVRGLEVSKRQPALISCGEDKMVKYWDLETNKVIRHFHGHLSAVMCLKLFDGLDFLATGGRDSVVRVWDLRSRSQVMTLSAGGTVSSVQAQPTEPMITCGSLDGTVRAFDIRQGGKCMATLTHHKKGVRSITPLHPNESTFASCSTGAIKQWRFPQFDLMQNFEAPNSVINTLSVNGDNVLFAGCDDGGAHFFDWKTGHKFQTMDSIAQPGSLDAEAGVFTSTFDKTGLRLITGEADKTVKIWRPDDTATEDNQPLEWKPQLGVRKY